MSPDIATAASLLKVFTRFNDQIGGVMRDGSVSVRPEDADVFVNSPRA